MPCNHHVLRGGDDRICFRWSGSGSGFGGSGVSGGLCFTIASTTGGKKQ